MSTFRGKLAEIPEISIDRFDEVNLDSQAFFLSHCHTDHMVGLDSSDFQQKLVENGRFLYLSHVSAEIIKKQHPKIADNLVELDQYSPTTVALEGKYISVIPVPAGHCPGSVMFLFEGDKTVLYTGDYRINSEDIPKLKAFYNCMNIQKNVDTVYLDTTFFLKKYSKFPPRAESLEEICNIIRDWLNRSDKHVIALSTSAKYGYEYLFMEIFKKVKMPIHVNDEIYQFYSRVPELDEAVTKTADGTRIHNACGSTYTVICKNTVAYKIKTIRISAFRWKTDDLQNGISDCRQNNHFVCYSTHASYEEGVALLKFLKPKRVEPNVLHNNSKTDQEIYRNIEENLEWTEPTAKKLKLFETEKQQMEPTEARGECNILDSP
ncbi:Lactamase B 2 and/or DRMBL domain containing protein [Asbolus verrucosus]|uniref:Lactamase B 2 and/or DRMBL domain containing protein n=1 Tax=Asbolus verrucosus TaxID=1661398 RepID=A0A482WBK5_ASBVE|nr:Lactamase B 2 and/or DRMBL domain containing protein [Asbolus verrucosus]